MEVGKLFVSLGIKGSEKSVEAVTGVKDVLGKTASSGLAAKAALVGAMYALERFFSASNARGTELANFNAILGEGTETLQRYQYAAKHVADVNADEVAGSFKTIQDVMAKILISGDVPAGMDWLSKMTGTISEEDIEEWSRHPEKFIQRLQQYAKAEKNPALANYVIESMGLGTGMEAAIKRQAFTAQNLANAPVRSEGQVKALDKVRQGWSDLHMNVDKTIDNLNAKFGGKLVSDINKLLPAVTNLISAFATLADKAHAFEWIGKAFQGWTEIFKGLTEEIQQLTGVIPKGPPGTNPDDLVHPDEAKKPWYLRDTTTNQDVDDARELKELWDETIGAFFSKKHAAGASGKAVPHKALPSPAAVATPQNNHAMSMRAAEKPAALQIQQNLNFSHDGSNATQTADATRTAVNKAFWTYSTLTQAT